MSLSRSSFQPEPSHEMFLLPPHLLEDTLSSFEVLQSIFPLPGELDIPPETTATFVLLRSLLESSPPSSSSLSSSSISLSHLTARIRIAIEPPPGAADPEDVENGWLIVVKVEFPIDKRGQDREGGPSTSITILQPSWISDHSFQDLTSSPPASSVISPEIDPTSQLLDLAEHLRIFGPKLIPLALPPLPSSSPITRPSNPRDSHSMYAGKEAILCLSKMHRTSFYPSKEKPQS